MTLKQIIDLVDTMRPNDFPAEVKTQWLNDLETMIQAEVLLFAPEDVITYDYSVDSNCEMLIDKLSRIEGARVAKLIGQSKGGLKQKEQVQLLEDFKGGKYNIIVSTSVGEDGLDIASTDMVVFYEPIPSEIRTIQRRGRTGRKNTGEVYVLVAVGTRDEISEKTSAKKEEQMKALLDGINDDLAKRGPSVSKKQFRLDNF